MTTKKWSWNPTLIERLVGRTITDVSVCEPHNGRLDSVTIFTDDGEWTMFTLAEDEGEGGAMFIYDMHVALSNPKRDVRLKGKAKPWR